MKKKDTLSTVAFLAPAVLLLLVFVFYPIVKTIYTSFHLTDVCGKTSMFVGFDNYMSLFKNTAFQKSTLMTLVFVAAVTALTIVLSLAMANFATKKLRGAGFFKTVFSSTMGVSISVGAVLWLFIFNPTAGPLAKLLALMNLPVSNVLSTPSGAMLAVVISTVWLNLGFAFLILLGAIQSLPSHLYECAEIEGLTSRYQFFHITLPMISPTLFFVVVVTVIDAFKGFGLIDLMTAGGPDNTSNFLVYKIYQDAFISGDYSVASAESIVLAIIIGIFTMLQFKVLEKRVTY